VIKYLLEPKWVELSPREIYYKLLDEEHKIIASVSTFYRIARDKQLLTQRLNIGTGKKLNRVKPELLAVRPNEIWSWDVTQILSDCRNRRYYLYVIIDIWSRYVVGWTLELHEQTESAIKMWKQALADQMLTGSGLINHKDNGAIMTANEMIKFVHDAQMVDSYSRAGVSDDNPYSESLFRTVQYFRSYPECFSSIELARDYFTKYFDDYNNEFRHSGIQFITPAARHYGDELKILNQRNKLIKEFHNENPHRYSSKPKVFCPITEVRIN
jgi:putative transposase